MHHARQTCKFNGIADSTAYKCCAPAHQMNLSAGCPCVSVIDADEKFCYEIPRHWIHIAPDAKNFDKLQLCRRFGRSGGCPNGAKCVHVHLLPNQLTQCSVTPVHNNFVWKSLEDVEYECHRPGMMIPVRRPKLQTTFELPSDRVIVTEGTKRYVTNVQRGITPKAVGVCAHFLIGRTCRLGSSCHFVHFVTIDDSVVAKEKSKTRRLPTPQEIANPRVTARTPTLSATLSADSVTPGSAALDATCSSFGYMSPPSVDLELTVAPLPKTYTHNPYRWNIYAEADQEFSCAADRVF